MKHAPNHDQRGNGDWNREAVEINEKVLSRINPAFSEAQVDAGNADKYEQKHLNEPGRPEERLHFRCSGRGKKVQIRGHDPDAKVQNQIHGLLLRRHAIRREILNQAVRTQYVDAHVDSANVRVQRRAAAARPLQRV